MTVSLKNEDIWENILKSVKKNLNEQIFDTWFLPIKFNGCDDENKLIHLKASQIHRDWINSNYLDLVGRILSNLRLENYQLDWTIEELNIDTKEPQNEFSGKTFFEIDAGSFANTASSSGNKKETPQFIDLDPVENSLNSKYTFDKFVVGSCNQFAHAAAEAVVDAPGKTYNPMFIYGGVGLGKTHLMQATGYAIREKDKYMRIAYISSEKFMNELINAIRFDKTQMFRDKYRSIDVLLMDDVQFLAGKERTQEEFFHTFNELHNDQKQIFITSDCPPREIPTLEERLHSRFEWGLIADIEPPDLETKVAIIKRKADLEGVHIPDDIAFFIANTVKSNVRELEGTLVRLIAISSLHDLPISKMLAQDAMRNIVGDNEGESITMDKIIKLVANNYDLAIEEIKAKNNSRKVAVPRQVAMYLCKRFTNHSFPEIGRKFGGKHHTTVMHSVNKIEKLVKENRDFHKDVSELIDHICN